METVARTLTNVRRWKKLNEIDKDKNTRSSSMNMISFISMNGTRFDTLGENRIYNIDYSRNIV